MAPFVPATRQRLQAAVQRTKGAFSKVPHAVSAIHVPMKKVICFVKTRPKLMDMFAAIRRSSNAAPKKPGVKIGKLKTERPRSIVREASMQINANHVL